MTTTADSPTDELPTEPDTCGEKLDTDPSKVCQTRRIDGSDRCLVHHSDRRALIAQIIASDDPELNFGNSEVDQGLLDELIELNVIRRDTFPDYQGVVRFDRSTINADFSELHFSGVIDFSGASFYRSSFHETQFSGTAYFSHATFEGSISFSHATFEGRTSFSHATFEGSSDFNNATFEGRTSFSHATFEGRTSFSHATFQYFAYFNNVTFKIPAYFSRATFKNSAYFRNATFEDSSDFNNATFEGAAYFNNATFKIPAYFSRATFKNPAYFSNATFNSYTYFRNVAFESSASFSNATFEGSAYFNNATSKDSASFSEATFNDSAYFINATFKGSAYFDHATFKDSAYFDHATFKGSAYFSEATFEGRSFLNNATFEDSVVFSEATFNDSASFRNATFEDSVVLNEATFNDSVSFNEATFNGYASFNEATFAGNVYLRRTSFSDRVSLNETVWLKTIELSDVTFSGEVGFRDARIADVMTFRGSTFSTAVDFGGSQQGRCILLDDCKVLVSCIITVGGVPLQLNGLTASHPLTIDSRAPQGPPQSDAASVSIVQSTFVQPVTITANTRLTESSFRHSTGLDQLRFQGDPEWPVDRWGRTIIFDEVDPSSDISPRELEVLYRQLRAGLEASKAAPAAADFFYGEMEARRDHTRHQSKSTRLKRLWSIRYMSLRWWLLSLYKWCAGYGVRSWRAFASYFASVVVIGLSFFFFNVQLVDSIHATAPEVESFWEAMAFSLRNSIYLFSAPDLDLQPWGIMVLALGRLAGVAFLALAVIGLRSHTER